LSLVTTAAPHSDDHLRDSRLIRDDEQHDIKLADYEQDDNRADDNQDE